MVGTPHQGGHCRKSKIFFKEAWSSRMKPLHFVKLKFFVSALRHCKKPSFGGIVKSQSFVKASFHCNGKREIRSVFSIVMTVPVTCQAYALILHHCRNSPYQKPDQWFQPIFENNRCILNKQGPKLTLCSFCVYTSSNFQMYPHIFLVSFFCSF